MANRIASTFFIRCHLLPVSFESNSLQGMCQESINYNNEYIHAVINTEPNEHQPEFTITGTTLPFPESGN
jgi:hypothetical protein